MNGNEGLIEEELDRVYIDWINEFSKCGDIRLMEEKDVNDFMDWITICNVISLILWIDTQMIDAGKCVSNTGIFYLDVNHLDVQWIEWWNVNWLKAR